MDEAILNARFRLTPAEARIALGISRGETLATIAVVNGISLQTVRTQLKAIFTKTGVHRQAELAILITGLANSR
jgi:DNA-binding CsgD family transcriptional regulator